MTSKEKVMVGIFAFLLSNISIVLTLYVAGQFGTEAVAEPEPEPMSEEELAAIDAKNAAIAAKYAPKAYKQKQSRLNYVHTISEAMFICAEKLDATKPGTAKSYEFDYVASKFNEDTDIFHIFIELETPSREGSGYQQSDVNCDVDAAQRSVINFKIKAK